MLSTCFKATPSQTRKLFPMERLDKCQLSKILTEKQLACRYTFKNNYITPMLFKTADPKSLPKHVHWHPGTGGTSCRALRLLSCETHSCGLSPGGLDQHQRGWKKETLLSILPTGDRNQSRTGTLC